MKEIFHWQFICKYLIQLLASKFVFQGGIWSTHTYWCRQVNHNCNSFVFLYLQIDVSVPCIWSHNVSTIREACLTILVVSVPGMAAGEIHIDSGGVGLGKEEHIQAMWSLCVYSQTNLVGMEIQSTEALANQLWLSWVQELSKTHGSCHIW